MDNLLQIRLRAFHPGLGHDRYYKISLGMDLFNCWFVTVTFGRYGTGGTSKRAYFNHMQKAYHFIGHVLKKRLSSPKRIGRPYQLVEVDGRDDILAGIDVEVIRQFSWFDTRTPVPHSRAWSTVINSLN